MDGAKLTAHHTNTVMAGSNSRIATGGIDALPPRKHVLLFSRFLSAQESVSRGRFAAADRLRHLVVVFLLGSRVLNRYEELTQSMSRKGRVQHDESSFCLGHHAKAIPHNYDKTCWPLISYSTRQSISTSTRNYLAQSNDPAGISRIPSLLESRCCASGLVTDRARHQLSTSRRWRLFDTLCQKALLVPDLHSKYS